MRSVNALALSPNVSQWLATTRHPRVLHIFDRACNLINEQGEVLSVVAAEIGNGPFNLVVATEILFAESIDLEAPIFASTHRLDLGDLTIQFSEAQLWNPQPDWDALYATRRTIAPQLANFPITHEPFPAPLVSPFAAALVRADVSAAMATASKLAGLGIGLTPSGDDFLMGALYAVWIIHPHEIAQVLASEVATVAAPLTTSLSAAWLRAAGQGEAGGVWHEFFEASISGKMQRIQTAMNKILAVGETSGADALAGLISVFNVYQEKELASYENSSR